MTFPLLVELVGAIGLSVAGAWFFRVALGAQDQGATNFARRMAAGCVIGAALSLSHVLESDLLAIAAVLAVFVIAILLLPARKRYPPPRDDDGPPPSFGT